MAHRLKKMIENFSPSILFSSKEDELARLEELYSLQLIDSPPEEDFDRITRLVSSIFHVPIALVTLITEDSQFIKSCYGVDIKETPREHAFCQHVIANKQSMVIEDFLLDTRFQLNPLVKDFNLRFYAGAPLVTRQNNYIGSLCIIDLHPRKFSEAELKQLQVFADIVVSQIEKKQQISLHNELENRLMEVNTNYSRIVNHVNDVVFQTDDTGNFVFLSPSWTNVLGFPVKESLGTSFF